MRLHAAAFNTLGRPLAQTSAGDTRRARTQARRKRAKRVFKRGVGAGRSVQRGTSGATTGPRGAAGPHNPDNALARSAPPNPERVYRLLSRGAASSPDPY